MVKPIRLATLAAAAVVTVGVAGLRAEDAKEATCPISGHKVAITDKTATLTVNGEKQYFCCENCPAAMVKEPTKYIKTTAAMACPVMKANKVSASGPRLAINDNLFLTCCAGCPQAIEKTPTKFVTELRDPVSKATFKLTNGAPHSSHKGVHYYFANEDNKKAFDASPDKYANKWLSKAG